MHNIKKKVKKERGRKHPLFAQVLFTVLAFVMMVALSYYFARSLVNTSLMRYTESVFTFAQAQIEEDLAKGSMTLGGFSQTIRTMILRGNSVDEIQIYMNDVADYLSDNGFHTSGGNDLFCYLEAFPEGNVFLNSVGWAPPDTYVPTSRPWYINAIGAEGNIVISEPYLSTFSGELIVTFSRSIHGIDGAQLGIVCLNARVKEIGRIIVATAHERDAFGMLLDRNLYVLIFKRNSVDR